jgi:hypothetical protein
MPIIEETINLAKHRISMAVAQTNGTSKRELEIVWNMK